MRIHIAPPFAGEATLLVLTDKVLSLRTLSVPEGGTDVDVPVETAWGPGAYVAVHVFRPARAARKRGPAARIGLAWVGVDPAARTLPVAHRRAGPLRRRAAACRAIAGAGRAAGRLGRRWRRWTRASCG